jgi:hypothetical protein
MTIPFFAEMTIVSAKEGGKKTQNSNTGGKLVLVYVLGLLSRTCSE